MEQYYFLFGIAIVWIVFAIIQDLKTTEVSNWLNYSLIVFVLAYRAFYAINVREIMFFVYGLIGILMFVAFGYLFYYGRIFAGGDAKLLMGLGGILPFESVRDYLFLGGGFIFLLFIAGLLWSLIYSLTIVYKRKESFINGFKEVWRKNRKWLAIIIVFALILELISFNNSLLFRGFILLSFVILFLLYVYARALDRGCMDILKDYRKLQEGDWLINDVRVRGRWVRKSVHGLSKEDIKKLQKAKKKVWIKEGIPFTPAFLISLIVFICFWFKGFFSLI